MEGEKEEEEEEEEEEEDTNDKDYDFKFLITTSGHILTNNMIGCQCWLVWGAVCTKTKKIGSIYNGGLHL